jgi:putative Holliday junction resolvase
MVVAPAKAVLALDVGTVRIGIAVAKQPTWIARPLTTLANDAHFKSELTTLCAEHEVASLIVGLPRGLDGQETQQTRLVVAFAQPLADLLRVPLIWQDEAVTSQQAEAELQARHKPYKKADIDALAATYILEDYLQERAARHE